MSQERKRRIAIAIFSLGGLAGGFYISLDLAPGDRGGAWRGFALAAAGGGLLGALVGACTGAAVALGLAAILRER